MPELDDKNNPVKHSLMGHLRLLPIMVFFGMLAYGSIRLLIWIVASLGEKFNG